MAAGLKHTGGISTLAFNEKVQAAGHISCRKQTPGKKLFNSSSEEQNREQNQEWNTGVVLGKLQHNDALAVTTMSAPWH